MTQSPDYDSIPAHLWELVDATPTFRTWVFHIDEKTSVMKTEYLHIDALLKQNQIMRDMNDGEKWGDTPWVASIPLNVLYDSKNQIMEKQREGDRDHLKWFLNRPENQIFRTKRGTI